MQHTPDDWRMTLINQKPVPDNGRLLTMQDEYLITNWLAPEGGRMTWANEQPAPDNGGDYGNQLPAPNDGMVTIANQCLAPNDSMVL